MNKIGVGVIDDVGWMVAQLVPGVIRGAQLEAAAKRGITSTQFRVLTALKSRHTCSMTTLASDLGARLPTATGLVDRMVGAGWIRRRSVDHDRRRVYVELTPKGDALVEHSRDAVKDRWKQVLDALSPAELRTFHILVHKLLTRLDIDA